MSNKCPKCGRELAEGESCPACEPRKQPSTLDEAAHKTGEAIEKGVELTGKAVNEVKPVAKEVAGLGVKGLRAAKRATLDVAKELKKKGE